MKLRPPLQLEMKAMLEAHEPAPGAPHREGATTHGGPIVDHPSSAPRFDGWRGPVVSLPTREPWRPRRPHTWLHDEGWRIHGLLHPAELPAAARRA